jgi:hypothetical protein
LSLRDVTADIRQIKDGIGDIKTTLNRVLEGQP